MFLAVHISLIGTVDEIEIHALDDNADVVRDHHLESLTSGDGQLDFWFTPSTHRSQRLNRLAPSLLSFECVYGSYSVRATLHWRHRHPLASAHVSSGHGSTPGLASICLGIDRRSRRA